jgi:hypothetical protein
MRFTPVDAAGGMCHRLLLQHRVPAAVSNEFAVAPDRIISRLDVARRGPVFAPQDRAPLLRAQISSAMHKLGEEGCVVQEANRITSCRKL